MVSVRQLYVLVIAHPDDESMFFVPTIHALVRQRQAQQRQQHSGAPPSLLWILCLTTGDYDGLGEMRRKELERAGDILGVDKVIVHDESKGSGGNVCTATCARSAPGNGQKPAEMILDHPRLRWNSQYVAETVANILELNISELMKNVAPPEAPPALNVVLMTFDEGGVSGHINHADTYFGVRCLVDQNLLENRLKSKHSYQLNVEAWQLVTETNLLSKYIPLVGWLLLLWSVVSCTVLGESEYRVSEDTSSSLLSRWRSIRLHQPTLNWRAMTTHASQFVWYRRLFVVFSCYTYINRWSPISTETFHGSEQSAPAEGKATKME